MAIPWWIHTSVFVLGLILSVCGLGYIYRIHSNPGVELDDVFFVVFFSFTSAMAVFLYFIPSAWAFFPFEPLPWGPTPLFQKLANFFGAVAATIVTFYGWISRLR